MGDFALWRRDLTYLLKSYLVIPEMIWKWSLLNYLDLSKDIFNGDELYLLTELYIFSQENSLIENRLKPLKQ